MYDMRDNSNLPKKLVLMKITWPRFSDVAECYQNPYTASMALERLSTAYTEEDWFKRACIYRNRDSDYFEEDNESVKVDIVRLWLMQIINEAIEECVIKIPSEDLLPEDPLAEVSRYLKLKLFGEWKPVSEEYSSLYINQVGDYYEASSNRILQPSVTDGRYKMVNIYYNKKIRGVRLVHRDVGRLFVPNPDNKPQINHINGVKTCNAVYNLEWCTLQENMDHARAHNLILKGDLHPMAKYTEKQIRQVCDLLKRYPPLQLSEIAQQTGVSKGMVKSISQSKNHTDIAKDYDFVSRNRSENSYWFKYPDDQIRQVCQLLQDHPEWTFKEISEKTRVDESVVGDLYRKERRKLISEDYNFPPRLTTKYRIQTYSRDQLLNACRALKDHPNWSYPEIEKATGVSTDVIGDLYNGLTHTDISAPFQPFPSRNTEKMKVRTGDNNGMTKYSDEQVEKLCSLLDEKIRCKPDMKLSDIAKEARVSLKLVKTVWGGQARLSVSKNHYFYKTKFPDRR